MIRNLGIIDNFHKRNLVKIAVAPHAGAWIEIFMSKLKPSVSHVAPHAGAWIEIAKHKSGSGNMLSLPMRERGLKLLWLQKIWRQRKSLPMRERGLKYDDLVTLVEEH